MSHAPRHSLTADFAEFELLLDGDIDDPLLYDKIPIEPSECLGVFDATPIKSSGSLIFHRLLQTTWQKNPTLSHQFMNKFVCIQNTLKIIEINNNF